MSIRYPAGRITLSIDPLAVPDAPASATATATGKTTASVAFTAPSNVGVSAVTSYSVVPTVGGTVVSTATSPASVTGLTAGTSYTFQVAATNSAGVGAVLASNTITTLTDPAYIAYYGDTASFNDISTISSDSSGNAYFNGTFTTGGTYAYLFGKYNTSGAIQWQRSLDSVNFDFGYSAIADSSGNVYVSGQTGTGAVFAKYNSSGTIQWQRLFNKSGIATQGGKIVLDSSGNIYLLAIQNNGTSNLVTALITKYNSTPTLQWTRSFGNASGQGAAFYFDTGDFALDSSGNIYIAGSIDSSASAVICKYDNSGNLQWQRKLTGSGVSLSNSRSAAKTVAVDSSGNVYAVYNGNNNNGFNYIFKYNTSGTLQWQIRYAMPSGNANYGAIAIDSSNNLYVLGNNSTTGVGYIVKLNSSGAQQWQRSMTATSLQFQCGQGSIAVDNAGSIYFSMKGNSGSPDFNSRYAFVKLPDDGSKTGTYSVGVGSFTYAVSTGWTLSTTTFTDAAGAETSATVTWTDAAATMTSATTTISSTTTTL